MAKRTKRAASEVLPGAALYKRISDDAEGLRLGVERQNEDLIKYAAETGIEIVESFEDNDISASTRSTKRRPRYEAMLAGARAGDFGTIIAYTSSRLTRRPRENEDLIELAEQYGIRFKYLRSPSFDLNTADGRNIARILAANDAAEAERTSERVARAAAQRLRDGGFHGGPVTFGFEAVKNDAGKTSAWVHHPVHKDWVVEAADRVLKGETIYGVVKDWRRKGRLTPSGKIWHSETLKVILHNPGIAGLREYDEALHPAPWEAIISPADWRKVVAQTPRQEPDQTPVAAHKDARRRYLLSGLLVCGLPDCGRLLSAVADSRQRTGAYICSVSGRDGCGRIRISMPALERFVVEAFLSTTDDLRVSRQDEEDTAQEQARAQVQALITQDEETLEEIQNDYYDKKLPKPAYLRQSHRITERLDANRRRRAYYDSTQSRTSLPAASVLRELWPSKDVMWQRTMLAANIDHITIGPFPTGAQRSLPRRRGESDESLATRRQEHDLAMLSERVHIEWIS